MMLTIRGVYDGKTVRLLPSEPLPEVDREVPVAIVFLESPQNGNVDLQAATEESPRPRPAREWEAARRMRAARDAMEPLDVSIPELIEEGRER